MYVRHREHCPAHQHAEQSADRRLEPRDVDQQPVLWIQAQRYHQDCPDDGNCRVTFEMSCKTTESETITCMRMELSKDFFKSQEPRLWHVQDVSEFTESFCCRCHGEQMLSRLSNNPPTELLLDEVQTGEERRVQLSVLYSAWDSGDAARQRGLWAAEWGKHTSPLAAHTHTEANKPSSFPCLFTDA